MVKLKQREEWANLDRRGNWLDYRDAIDGDERIEKRLVNPANGCIDIDPDTTHEEQNACPPLSNNCPSPVYDNCGNLTFDPLGRVAGFAASGCGAGAYPCGPG